MKLIDKDALIAEIERRKQDAINNCGGFKSMREHECDSCIVWQYEEMEDIINTLEVKEVGEDVQGIKDEGGIENFVKYVPADAFMKKAREFISTFFHPDDTELIDAVLNRFNEHMKLV